MVLNEKQLAQWAKTRRMGRSRFIWRVGVLYWGIITGTVWSIVMGAMQGWDQFPILLCLALIGFPIGGYFFGVWVWKLNESAYQKQRSD